jgi:hypothetical protein
MIQDSKLWNLGNTKSTRAKPWVECVPQSEAVTLAWEIHQNQGHFHRDNVKIALMDRIPSPHLDQSITKAIMDCGKCKGHGPKHLHSLLEPITWCHPFELLVGDTLSMLKGKGGLQKLDYMQTSTHSMYGQINSRHQQRQPLLARHSTTSVPHSQHPRPSWLMEVASLTMMLSVKHVPHAMWSYE